MLLSIQRKIAAANKLEQLITGDHAKGGEVIDHAMNNQPTDGLQSGASLSFDAEDDNNVRITCSDQAGSIQE